MNFPKGEINSVKSFGVFEIAILLALIGCNEWETILRNSFLFTHRSERTLFSFEEIYRVKVHHEGGNFAYERLRDSTDLWLANGTRFSDT